MKKHIKDLQSIAWFIVSVIICALFAWFVLSCLDVNMHNQINSNNARAAWNMFEVAKHIRAA